jgi:hypothetical protein
LSQAEKQKDFDRPNSSTTILTLHDLVECFLQLALEHLTNKNKLSGNNILDVYSEELNKVLVADGSTPINKAYIKRLNELRNQLKHVTIFIDKKNIENLYSETEIFISDFIQIFFEITLNDISILQLLTNEDIKNHLMDAEKKLIEKEYHKAIISIGKAFYEYKHIATSINDKRGYSMLTNYNSNVSYVRRSEITMGSKPLESSLRNGLIEIAKDINKINKEIINLREIQLLSVDIRKYLYFEDIMPHISKIQRHVSGKEFIIEFYIPEEATLTKENYTYEQVKFCFDFVIDSVFKFQNKIYL